MGTIILSEITQTLIAYSHKQELNNMYTWQQGVGWWTTRLGEVEELDGVDGGRVFSGSSAHYSSDGCTKGPDFTTMQYINVATLPFYSMNTDNKNIF